MAFETQIRLFGNEYILVGSLERGGPICIKEAYENFEVSYAHLMSDGKIMRFHEQIGTRKDIEILNTKVEVSPNPPIENVLIALADPEGWAGRLTQRPPDSLKVAAKRQPRVSKSKVIRHKSG